jgi:hypothetical protein
MVMPLDDCGFVDAHDWEVIWLIRTCCLWCDECDGLHGFWQDMPPGDFVEVGESVRNWICLIQVNSGVNRGLGQVFIIVGSVEPLNMLQNMFVCSCSGQWLQVIRIVLDCSREGVLDVSCSRVFVLDFSRKEVLPELSCCW